MILLDLTHTSHTTMQSGIQQVARNLLASLSHIEPVQPIVYDPYAKRFRPTDSHELANLNLGYEASPDRRRSAHWSGRQALRGTWQRLLDRCELRTSSSIRAILTPEIIPKKTPLHAYLSLRQQTNAPLMAIFHDAIPLRLPEVSPIKTVSYFPKYLRRLNSFDSIAAVSESSRLDLLDHWKFSNCPKSPETNTIPLGTRPYDPPHNFPPRNNAIPMILFVGSIEGRKNHHATLQAAESLWNQGLEFSLELVGVDTPETGGAAIRLLEKLKTKGRAIKWHGPCSEAMVVECYNRCDFTLYPSLWEGFGMPVIESLSRGKPTICSDKGGLSERVKGGGCLVPESLDQIGLAKAMKQLIEDRHLRETLSRETQNRSYKSWDQYAAEIHNWISQSKLI